MQQQLAAELPANHGRREHLLRVLSAITFLIFFQAFMVAPLLPRLADLFGVSVETIGLIVPAYLIPYGLATLAYGPLSDRFGRGRIIFTSLAAFIVLTLLTVAAWSWSSLLVFRLLERDQKLSGAKGFATQVRSLDVSIRAQSLEHNLNRGDVDHRFADFAQVLIIFAQAPIAGVPPQRSLHYPSPRLDDESLLVLVLAHNVFGQKRRGRDGEERLKREESR